MKKCNEAVEVDKVDGRDRDSEKDDEKEEEQQILIYARNTCCRSTDK